ncbi:hypothetical protein PMG11_06206 [Penicillium brasilianum]|uniref:ABM domain-containing protein n=1 Tax=Penicillium brasilianum TaxID=104259 RepID=A0A0F7TQ24_PENBI|nr:hypothetical protein PMG11_06206 [Penicillium brasilianum]
MSGITEIAFAPLKKGINVTDPGSDAYKTLTEEAFRRIKGWKACQRVYWGVEIEDPDKLRLFVNWDSLEAHEEANKDPAYLPAVIPIGSVCSGPHTVYHARFNPYPPTVLAEAPVTEVMTIYFPADYSLDDQKTYDDGMRKFFKACHTHAGGFLTSTGGWVHEVQKLEDGEEVKAYVALFGWESVDHHLAFRETIHFNELRKNMGQPKDLKKLEVVHVKVTEFKG